MRKSAARFFRASVEVGGVASYEGDVFVTDNDTSEPGASEGIVRFRASDCSMTRFASDVGFSDVTIGLDGELYALDDAQPPKFVRVYEPRDHGSRLTLGRDVVQ